MATEKKDEGAAVQEVHGAALSFGDVKKGGSAKKGLVAMLPRKSIHIVKGFNPRTSIGDTDQLEASVKKEGILSSIVVRPQADKPGHFDVVAGERRVRVAENLGLDEIPCIIRTDLQGDDERSKACAVAENSEDGRQNLNAIELGRVCLELQNKGWTVAQIAGETGLHPQKVRRCLTLVEGPEDVQKKVEKGELSMIAGLEVAKLDDATRKKIKDSLSVDTSAAEVRRLAKAAAKPSATEPGKSANKKKGASRDAALVAWKSSKAKQTMLAELSFHIQNAEASDKGTPDYHELRGSVSSLLWDRGDLESPVLPEIGTKESKELKKLSLFDKLVAAESKKYTPAIAESGAAAVEGGGGGE